MQRRAEMGYGTAKDPTTYIGLFRNDVQLRTMWVWIKYIQDYLTEFVVRSRVADAEPVQTSRSNGLKESASRSRGATRCLGALAILSGESNQSGLPTPSEVLTCVDWQGVDARLPFPRYRSPERSHVLRLCMWRLDDTDEVQRRVFESVCAEGEYGRAATMALFNLKFNWALSFLNRASTVHSSQTKVESKQNSTNEILINQEVGLVSLALAGYTDSNNDLWRATCASLFNRLENPYLRVMFAFLTRQGGDFNVILYNEDLRLNDRLAFACLYLDDNELLTFVKNTCDQMVLAGRLEAVLLTGIASTDFISLVQNYVDLTGDVQTAAVVGLRACQLCCSSNASNSRSLDCGPRRSELSGTRNAPSVAAAVVEEKIGRSSGRGAFTEKEAPLLLTLGGIRIAAWVQCYRDLLDQWRMWFCRADFDIANKVPLMSDYLTSATSHSKSTSVNPTAVSCSPQSPTPCSNAASSSVGDSGPGGTVRESSKTSVHEALLGVAHRSVNRPRLNVNLIAPVNQLFVACGFCGWRLGPQPRASLTSVGSGTAGSSGTADCTAMVSTTSPSRSLQMHGGGGKHTICQRCRKPLPRCSICLMHLGTTALPLTDFSLAVSTREDALRRSILAAVPTLTEHMTRVMQLSIVGASGQEGTVTTSDSALRSATDQHPSRIWLNCMTSLFIWCQACRHGGHASHLADWFHADSAVEGDPSNTMCPVSGCSCRCATLDSLRPISSARCLVQPRGRTADAPPPKISSESVSEEEEEEGEDADEESDEDRIGFDDIVLRGTYDTGPITQESNPVATSALCFAHDRSVNDFQRY
ncbi:WD repeat-containing protein mio [Paragonimus westermani]|uniref:WD repeat-containing protein mio n=1 Tax=Paragonimus westermani TaxID=34504 RepID=A0A5J4NEX1_9TREM|nr:WD repeat-containing protein mio [Paragonimus westermani]